MCVNVFVCRRAEICVIVLSFVSFVYTSYCVHILSKVQGILYPPCVSVYKEIQICGSDKKLITAIKICKLLHESLSLYL